MRVERVRYFEAAARMRSLRAAAAELGVSQPTLSAQIQLLEEELDLVLLTRTRQGVVPTVGGQALLEHARNLISAEDALKQGAIGISGLQRGTVRIGCVTVAIRAILWKVIKQLVEDHPGLSFKVQEGTSEKIADLVAIGELDIGLVASHRTDEATLVERIPVLDFRVLACVPKGHALADRSAVTIRELQQWPTVVQEPGSRLRNVLLSGSSQATVVFEASTIDTARQMVAQGIGVGVDTSLGAVTLAPTESELVYVPIADNRATLSLSLLRRRYGQPSKAVLLVSRLISDEASVYST